MSGFKPLVYTNLAQVIGMAVMLNVLVTVLLLLITKATISTATKLVYTLIYLPMAVKLYAKVIHKPCFPKQYVMPGETGKIPPITYQKHQNVGQFNLVNFYKEIPLHPSGNPPPVLLDLEVSPM